MLADFFKIFRGNCLERYHFDTIHHFSNPAMAWNAALKTSEVDLELVSTGEKYSLFQREFVVEFPKFPCDTTPQTIREWVKITLIQLIYLDGNNLYGCLIFCRQEGFNG